MSGQGQLFDLGEGLARKEAGLDQVEETDESRGRWIDRARTEAMRVARSRGCVTTDDLRKWATSTDDQPHHPNAWGAVFRGKLWLNSGLASSSLATNHGRRIFIWKLAKEAAL